MTEDVSAKFVRIDAARKAAANLRQLSSACTTAYLRKEGAVFVQEAVEVIRAVEDKALDDKRCLPDEMIGKAALKAEDIIKVLAFRIAAADCQAKPNLLDPVGRQLSSPHKQMFKEARDSLRQVLPMLTEAADADLTHSHSVDAAQQQRLQELLSHDSGDRGGLEASSVNSEGTKPQQVIGNSELVLKEVIDSGAEGEVLTDPDGEQTPGWKLEHLQSTPRGSALGIGCSSGGLEASLSSVISESIMPHQVICNTELVLKEVIGSGTEGKVYRGTWAHIEIAAKVYLGVDNDAADSATANIESSSEAAMQRARSALQKEVAWLMCFNHPNLVRFCGVCLDPPLVVMEFYKHGNVFQMIEKARRQWVNKQARRGATTSKQATKYMDYFTWDRRLEMLHDVSAGMMYLHHRHYVHGDLRSPNLFVGLDGRVKIGDFGFTKRLNSQQRSMQVKRITRPRWVAPELMTDYQLSAESDVYSFGIIMYEMLTWQVPFYDLTKEQVCFYVVAGSRPDIPVDEQLPPGTSSSTCLRNYIKLMQECWHQDPAKRPSFERIAARLKAMIRWRMVIQRNTLLARVASKLKAAGQAHRAAPTSPPAAKAKSDALAMMDAAGSGAVDTTAAAQEELQMPGTPVRAALSKTVTPFSEAQSSTPERMVADTEENPEPLPRPKHPIVQVADHGAEVVTDPSLVMLPMIPVARFTEASTSSEATNPSPALPLQLMQSAAPPASAAVGAEQPDSPRPPGYPLMDSTMTARHPHLVCAKARAFDDEPFAVSPIEVSEKAPAAPVAIPAGRTGAANSGVLAPALASTELDTVFSLWDGIQESSKVASGTVSGTVSSGALASSGTGGGAVSGAFGSLCHPGPTDAAVGAHPVASSAEVNAGPFSRQTASQQHAQQEQEWQSVDHFTALDSPFSQSFGPAADSDYVDSGRVLGAAAPAAVLRYLHSLDDDEPRLDAAITVVYPEGQTAVAAAVGSHSMITTTTSSKQTVPSLQEVVRETKTASVEPPTPAIDPAASQVCSVSFTATEASPFAILDLCDDPCESVGLPEIAGNHGAAVVSQQSPFYHRGVYSADSSPGPFMQAAAFPVVSMDRTALSQTLAARAQSTDMVVGSPQQHQQLLGRLTQQQRTASSQEDGMQPWQQTAQMPQQHGLMGLNPPALMPHQLQQMRAFLWGGHTGMVTGQPCPGQQPMADNLGSSWATSGTPGYSVYQYASAPGVWTADVIKQQHRPPTPPTMQGPAAGRPAASIVSHPLQQLPPLLPRTESAQQQQQYQYDTMSAAALQQQVRQTERLEAEGKDTEATLSAEISRLQVQAQQKKVEKLQDMYQKNLEVVEAILAKNRDFKAANEQLEARVEQLERDLAQAQARATAAASSEQDNLMKMAHDFKQHAEKANQIKAELATATAAAEAAEKQVQTLESLAKGQLAAERQKATDAQAQVQQLQQQLQRSRESEQQQQRQSHSGHQQLQEEVDKVKQSTAELTSGGRQLAEAKSALAAAASGAFLHDTSKVVSKHAAIQTGSLEEQPLTSAAPTTAAAATTQPGSCSTGPLEPKQLLAAAAADGNAVPCSVASQDSPLELKQPVKPVAQQHTDMQDNRAASRTTSSDTHVEAERSSSHVGPDAVAQVQPGPVADAAAALHLQTGMEAVIPPTMLSLAEVAATAAGIREPTPVAPPAVQDDMSPVQAALSSLQQLNSEPSSRLLRLMLLYIRYEAAITMSEVQQQLTLLSPRDSTGDWQQQLQHQQRVQLQLEALLLLVRLHQQPPVRIPLIQLVSQFVMVHLSVSSWRQWAVDSAAARRPISHFDGSSSSSGAKALLALLAIAILCWLLPSVAAAVIVSTVIAWKWLSTQFPLERVSNRQRRQQQELRHTPAVPGTAMWPATQAMRLPVYSSLSDLPGNLLVGPRTDACSSAVGYASWSVQWQTADSSDAPLAAQQQQRQLLLHTLPLHRYTASYRARSVRQQVPAAAPAGQDCHDDVRCRDQGQLTLVPPTATGDGATERRRQMLDIACHPILGSRALSSQQPTASFLQSLDQLMQQQQQQQQQEVPGQASTAASPLTVPRFAQVQWICLDAPMMLEALPSGSSLAAWLVKQQHIQQPGRTCSSDNSQLDTWCQPFAAALWHQVLTWLQQVAAALVELHSVGIVHGGLHAGTIHLADAGGSCSSSIATSSHMARYADSSGQDSSSTALLSLAAPWQHAVTPGCVVDAAFAPPEVQLGSHHPTSSPAVDVYGFGMVMWQLATGWVPQQSDPTCSQPAANCLAVYDELSWCAEMLQRHKTTFPGALGTKCTKHHAAHNDDRDEGVAIPVSEAPPHGTEGTDASRADSSKDGSIPCSWDRRHGWLPLLADAWLPVDYKQLMFDCCSMAPEQRPALSTVSQRVAAVVGQHTYRS